MAKSRNQKGKILVLEHLLQGTGESRIVTMQEILDKLLEYGITAERKSIYDDIEALRELEIHKWDSKKCDKTKLSMELDIMGLIHTFALGGVHAGIKNYMLNPSSIVRYSLLY